MTGAELFIIVKEWLSVVRLALELVLRGVRRRPEDWELRLQDFFPAQDSIRLHGLPRNEPQIKIEGKVDNLSQTQIAYAEEQRIQIEKNRRDGKLPSSNDPHAILIEEPSWGENPVTFKVRTLEYAEVLALKNADPQKVPRRISANALMICRKTKEVILHERDVRSETFGGFLHTPGGSFMPPGYGPIDDDHRLSRTVRREVLEELSGSINLDENPPMLLMEEVQTGFVQLTFLGVNISAAENKNLRANLEGRVCRIKFSELKDKLVMPVSWVSTGKAAVLAWLALGAPNAGFFRKFAEYKAADLFDLVVPRRTSR